MILAAILLLVATVVVSGWMIVTWIYREISFRGKIGDPKKLVPLSSSEREELSEWKAYSDTVSEEIKCILKEGSDLTRRADGHFNERSSLGVELNKRLRPAVKEAEKIEASIAQLESRPLKRFQIWSQRKSQLSGHRFSVLILVTLFFSFLISGPEWVIELGGIPLAILGTFFGSDEGLTDQELLVYSSCIVSTWISFGSYHLRRLVVSSSHKRVLRDIKIG